jgi:hypothetical protein
MKGTGGIVFDAVWYSGVAVFTGGAAYFGGSAIGGVGGVGGAGSDAKPGGGGIGTVAQRALNVANVVEAGKKVLSPTPPPKVPGVPPVPNSGSRATGGQSAPKGVHPNPAAPGVPAAVPACNPEWGCIPDTSGAAGPHGQAPAANPIVSSEEFTGDPEDAEFWNDAAGVMFDVATAVVPGPKGLRALLRAKRLANRLKAFEKLGIKTTEHFRNRLAQRAGRGITEAKALDAYKNGRLYYNQATKNYVRHSSSTGVSVVTDAPAGGRAITVFEGSPSPDWIPVRWRPGL